MAIPAGVVTKTLIVHPGQSTSPTTAVPSVEVLVEPVHPDTETIVWSATSQTLVSFFRLIRTGPDQAAVIPLPAINQPGFVDSRTAPVVNWWYKVTVRYLMNGRKIGQRITKLLMPLTTDPDYINFDEVPDVDVPTYSGAPGTPGAPGQPGQPGATGKSAYEIAVMLGFGGTEQDWLNSLKGQPGPQGPPGDAGAAQSYTHYQMSPSDTWVINHPLSFTPNIVVIDSTGTAVEGDIEYVGSHTISVSFSGAFSGTAYLS